MTGGRRVVGFGDNVVDRFLDRGVLYPGGNCVNFAVYARRLGVASAYLGVIADDDAARHIRHALTELGVDISRCVERHGPTGSCDVTVVDGDRVFGDWSGGVVVNQPFVPTPDDYAYLAGFDLVHLGPYAKLEHTLPTLHAHAPLISFDFSDEPEQRSDEYVGRVAPWVDLAVLSVAELDWDAAAALAEAVVARGAGLCLVTRGLEGSGVFDGFSFHRADAVAVEPLDTMGAGDSFITAFAISLLDSGWTRGGRPGHAAIRWALTRAARFAADQCSIEGAFGYAKEYL